jgi:hypothetical protein
MRSPRSPLLAPHVHCIGRNVRSVDMSSATRLPLLALNTSHNGEATTVCPQRHD